MLYYNLENICSTNFFGPITFIVFAEQFLSYSVLKVQIKKKIIWSVQPPPKLLYFNK